MTKEELVAVVDYAHALWSKQPPKGDAYKLLCRAWYDVLGDLDPLHVKEALTFLSGEREWLARPAQVRRLVVDATSEEGPAPSGDEAWEIWLDLANQMSHGTASPTQLHPVVASTIRKMKSGDTRDRVHFVGLYEAERTRYEIERYSR